VHVHRYGSYFIHFVSSSVHAVFLPRQYHLIGIFCSWTMFHDSVWPFCAVFLDGITSDFVCLFHYFSVYNSFPFLWNYLFLLFTELGLKLSFLCVIYLALQ